LALSPSALKYIGLFYHTLHYFIKSTFFILTFQNILFAASVYILLLGMYQSMLRTSIQIFDCEKDEKGISRLSMDNRECPAGGKDQILSIVGSIGLIVYGIVSYCYMKKKREKKNLFLLFSVPATLTI
jgi:hypothetical protein